jgi:hypothetical protein
MRHTDDADIFQQRVDARDTTAHKVAVALRMSTLADRYPHALIWGVTGHESGPHLICWDAAPDEVWVWQALPTDDPYAGLDLTTDLRPLVAAVALDPLSAGRPVRPGPTFAGLGMPGQQSTADGSFAARGLIRVSDAGPGRQFFAAEPGRPAAEARRHTADVMRRADALRAAVLAAAPMVSALRLDRGETAGWLRA